MLSYKKDKNFCENTQYLLVIQSELVTKSCKYGKVVSMKCLTPTLLCHPNPCPVSDPGIRKSQLHDSRV